MQILWQAVRRPYRALIEDPFCGHCRVDRILASGGNRLESNHEFIALPSGYTVLRDSSHELEYQR